MTDSADRPEIVVVAGLSGAGRSTAADALEDLGWFVIDNLPPAFIPRVTELSARDYERIALVVGAAGPQQAEVLGAVQELERDVPDVRILFLDAPTDALVVRYKVARRRHPLSTGSLTEAVEAERELLAGVREVADLVIDTGSLNVHELRDRIVEAFADGGSADRMLTRILSFSYKLGVPTDVDLVFDCRFLPNPHWVEELRPFTGRDEAVRDFVLGKEVTKAFLERLDALLELTIPAYVSEGKHYLTIAFGCTGGKHRSVAIAEEVGRRLSDTGLEVKVVHREVGP